ncbi:MAG: hypothetical protein EXR39_07360 [Betaproteobacteria bacterium]|nr:hypothetical protein [Betaproteobacteria bacterium]
MGWFAMRWLDLLLLASTVAMGASIVVGANVANAQTPPQFEAVPALPEPASSADIDPFANQVSRPALRSSEEVERSFRDGKHVSRVRNPAGAEYMLIEDHGDGTYLGQVPSDSGVRPPLWILFKF